MRYAVLRLEEEIRIVLDVRRSISDDPDYKPDAAAALMIETSKQLRDLVQALHVLERASRGQVDGSGESTLSAGVRIELFTILGFTTNSKDTPI